MERSKSMSLRYTSALIYPQTVQWCFLSCKTEGFMHSGKGSRCAFLNNCEKEFRRLKFDCRLLVSGSGVEPDKLAYLISVQVDWLSLQTAVTVAYNVLLTTVCLPCHFAGCLSVVYNVLCAMYQKTRPSTILFNDDCRQVLFQLPQLNT